jgi:hypothetical protein
MKAVREHRLIHAMLAAATVCAGLAHAQEVTPVGGLEECATLYVDSVCGNDSNPGTEWAPMKTARAAITRAGNIGGPATVVFMPGDYLVSTPGSASTPILMPPNVSLVGTSVLNTGIEKNSLLFQASIPGAYDDVIIENISFRAGLSTGAMVQITNSADHPLASNPTFANCVFEGSEGIGVLIDSVNSGTPPLLESEDADANGLLEHRPKFINCTFAGNKFGVVDRSTWGWGENEAGFINCLFRNGIPTGQGSDMEGVDASDLSLTNSAACSNAWRSTGNTQSSIKPGRSAPDLVADRVFDTAITSTTRLFFCTPWPQHQYSLDYRLTPTDWPDNNAVNAGVINFDPVWQNDTRGQRYFPCGQDAWDTDGEGYGNERIFEDNVDIGADEMGMFVVANYQPKTTQLLPGPPAGLPTAQVWLARPPANFVFPAKGISGFSIRKAYCSNWAQWEPRFTPGLRAIHATQPTPTPFGTLYLAANFAQRSDVFIDRYTSVPIDFGSAPTLRQINHQILPVDSNGVLGPLTNLQTYFAQ